MPFFQYTWGKFFLKGSNFFKDPWGCLTENCFVYYRNILLSNRAGLKISSSTVSPVQTFNRNSTTIVHLILYLQSILTSLVSQHTHNCKIIVLPNSRYNDRLVAYELIPIHNVPHIFCKIFKKFKYNILNLSSRYLNYCLVSSILEFTTSGTTTKNYITFNQKQNNIRPGVTHCQLLFLIWHCTEIFTGLTVPGIRTILRRGNFDF